MEAYRLGKNPIKMPTGWHDVNYNKAFKILNDKLNEVQILALLTDQTEEQIRKSTDIETIFYFLNAFKFLGQLPERMNEFPRSVKMGRDHLIFPFISYANGLDLGHAEFGQVEDMQGIITKMGAEFTGDEERLLEEKEIIQIYPHIVAIYVQAILDREYDGLKAQALVERVKEELSFKEILGIGNFFLMRLGGLTNGQVKEFQRRNTIRRKLRLAFLNSIQRLVSWLP